MPSKCFQQGELEGDPTGCAPAGQDRETSAERPRSVLSEWKKMITGDDSSAFHPSVWSLSIAYKRSPDDQISINFALLCANSAFYYRALYSQISCAIFTAKSFWFAAGFGGTRWAAVASAVPGQRQRPHLPTRINYVFESPLHPRTNRKLLEPLSQAVPLSNCLISINTALMGRRYMKNG